MGNAVKVLDLNAVADEVVRIAKEKMDSYDVDNSIGKQVTYTDALIGLLEDTIDSYDYETAYTADQREAFEYWLRVLKERNL